MEPSRRQLLENTLTSLGASTSQRKSDDDLMRMIIFYTYITRMFPYELYTSSSVPLGTVLSRDTTDSDYTLHNMRVGFDTTYMSPFNMIIFYTLTDDTNSIESGRRYISKINAPENNSPEMIRYIKDTYNMDDITNRLANIMNNYDDRYLDRLFEIMGPILDPVAVGCEVVLEVDLDIKNGGASLTLTYNPERTTCEIKADLPDANLVKVLSKKFGHVN